MGQVVEAESHFAEALRADSDPWISKHRLSIEESLNVVRGYIARVEIHGEPSGAVVSINGTDVGTLPMPAPLKIRSGNVAIGLRADGYRTQEKTLTIGATEFRRVAITLEKEVSQVAATQLERPATFPAKTAEATSDLSMHAPSELAEQPGAPIWVRPAAWTSAAASVLFLGGGIAAHLSRNAKVDDFNKDCFRPDWKSFGNCPLWMPE